MLRALGYCRSCGLAMRLLVAWAAQITFLTAALFVITLHLLTPSRLSPAKPGSLRTLGVASDIFVISLQRRTDRRSGMLKLADIMHLNFTWVDAVDANDPDIAKIMQHVRAQRYLESLSSFKPGSFKDAVTHSTPDGLFGSDLWTLNASDPRAATQNSNKLSVSRNLVDTDVPIPCTKGSPFRPLAVPPGKPGKTTVLSKQMVACWHSHLQLIRRIVRAPEHRVAIVFEDDVDLEWDVEARLVALWPYMPQDWDIVFLGPSHNPVRHRDKPAAPPFHPFHPFPPANAHSPGYCWSDESRNAPIISINETSLHPSYSPQCTHAYALSTRGARRLLEYLRHPAFAYSRAIDQAIAWLVRRGHLKSYSIVPPVAIQTREGRSDIWEEENGSSWKESLRFSARMVVQSRAPDRFDWASGWWMGTYT